MSEPGNPQRLIGELVHEATPVLSFEFFPPKTDEGERHLWRAIRELEPLHPGFVSVTYGAGGSTRDRTARVTERIATDTTLTAMAHLTCVGASRAEVRRVVGRYADAGIRNVLALRGDPPGGPGQAYEPHPDGFEYAAELVEFVAGLGGFSVGVAAFPDVHPEAANAMADAENLCRKADAGASFAITQFFFDADSYFQLVDRVRSVGCDLPIIPGLMPVTNVAQIERFAQLSGTAVPAAVASRFHEIADDAEAVRELGVEVAADLGARLLNGGAPGLHFYTLNRSTATREVARTLGLTTAA